MPTEALTCPTCGANDSSRADAHGLHTCVYCGVRYRITGGLPVAMPTAMPIAKRRAMVVTGIVGAATIIGVLVLVTAKGDREPPRSAPQPAAPITVVATPIASPAGASGTPVVVEAPPVVVEAPEPEAPARARFEMHHRRPSSGTTFYATGQVINESPYAIDKPKITAVMKDAAGAEVATAHGYADDALGPGATDAAEVLVMNPPAFATIDFEIAPRKSTYFPGRVEGLRVEPGPIEPASFGAGFKASGKVVHGGTAAARFVHVRAIAFDAGGKILGVDDTYADAEVLQPGATARFDLPMQAFSEKPTKWEFTVNGMTVD